VCARARLYEHDCICSCTCKQKPKEKANTHTKELQADVGNFFHIAAVYEMLGTPLLGALRPFPTPVNLEIGAMITVSVLEDAPRLKKKRLFFDRDRCNDHRRCAQRCCYKWQQVTEVLPHAPRERVKGVIGGSLVIGDFTHYTV
jgi:hypothetical protein